MFRLTAGREALRLSATGEAIVHLKRARRFLAEAGMPGMRPPKPDETHLRNLYQWLIRANKLAGLTEQAGAVAVVGFRLGFCQAI